MENFQEKVEDLMAIAIKLAEDIDYLIFELEMERNFSKHLESALKNAEETINYLKRYLEECN